jgi:hypothetical protein
MPAETTQSVGLHEREQTMTIVVQNRYFANADDHEDALALRRRASEIRRNEGRPVGRILFPVEVGPEVPNFVWECEYPDIDTERDDAAWADSSVDFSACREDFAPVLKRFERLVFEVVKD